MEAQGYKPHYEEVFCPSSEHCWVDVAAVKGQEYWAFEYKSQRDSIRRGLEQCCAYAIAFHYVVLVADRHRVTSSPYFPRFKQHGFGVWRHDGKRFQVLLNPKRRLPVRNAKAVVERQFRPNPKSPGGMYQTSLLPWLEVTGSAANLPSLWPLTGFDRIPLLDMPEYLRQVADGRIGTSGAREVGRPAEHMNRAHSQHLCPDYVGP